MTNVCGQILYTIKQEICYCGGKERWGIVLRGHSCNAHVWMVLCLYVRCTLGNHGRSTCLAILGKGVFLCLMYVCLEKVLLYLSVDQYNNVWWSLYTRQRLLVCRWDKVDRTKVAMLPNGRRGQIDWTKVAMLPDGRKGCQMAGKD